MLVRGPPHARVRPACRDVRLVRCTVRCVGMSELRCAAVSRRGGRGRAHRGRVRPGIPGRADHLVLGRADEAIRGAGAGGGHCHCRRRAGGRWRVRSGRDPRCARVDDASIASDIGGVRAPMVLGCDARKTARPRHRDRRHGCPSGSGARPVGRLLAGRPRTRRP